MIMSFVAKTVLLIVMLFGVVGCGRWQRFVTGITGDVTYKCVRGGVTYVQSDSGIALLVDSDGKPVRCTPND